ncbi:MAG: sugar phosphate isomerase/epimerase [Gemmataceae bacterium]
MSPAQTRRQFLATSAALVAASQIRADDTKPYGPWTIGVQSYSFREFDLEGMLKRTKELGLKHAEFYSKHVPPTSTSGQVAAILKLCAEYDVKPMAFGVQSFTKDHDANKKLFDFGKSLGIKVFSADPNPDSFDSLDKLCDEYKIAIAIHPHGPSGRGLHRWYGSEVIMPAIKDHNPLIGTCIDTAHILRCEQLGKKLDPADEIRKMGKRNFGLHLKDHDNQKKTDVVFGQGPLDVRGVLRALKDVGFQSTISLEYEANPKNPSPDMAACLDVLRKAVKEVG